jgi:hypothetical protein
MLDRLFLGGCIRGSKRQNIQLIAPAGPARPSCFEFGVLTDSKFKIRHEELLQIDKLLYLRALFQGICTWCHRHRHRRHHHHGNARHSRFASNLQEQLARMIRACLSSTARRGL